MRSLGAQVQEIGCTVCGCRECAVFFRIAVRVDSAHSHHRSRRALEVPRVPRGGWSRPIGVRISEPHLHTTSAPFSSVIEIMVKKNAGVNTGPLFSYLPRGTWLLSASSSFSQCPESNSFSALTASALRLATALRGYGGGLPPGRLSPVVTQTVCSRQCPCGHLTFLHTPAGAPVSLQQKPDSGDLAHCPVVTAVPGSLQPQAYSHSWVT